MAQSKEKIKTKSRENDLEKDQMVHSLDKTLKQLKDAQKTKKVDKVKKMLYKQNGNINKEIG